MTGPSKSNSNLTFIALNLSYSKGSLDLDLFFVLRHIQQPATGSLWVDDLVHTSWSRLCTVNHWASASNYQLSNMKCSGRDSNRQCQRLKASTLTATTTEPIGDLRRNKTKKSQKVSASREIKEIKHHGEQQGVRTLR